jgi:phosphohistidine phosphatase
VKLVLLRHAKSAWPDVPDHQRPLAGRGRRDAPAVGRWLLRTGHVPSQVMCSTARRARQTWELAQAEIDVLVPVSFEDGVYQAAAAGLLDLVRQVPPVAETLLVVGHDPGLPDLALMLARGSGDGPGEQTDPLRRMKVKFPTAAVAVLEFAGPTWSRLGPAQARLTDFVSPRDIPH